MTHPRRKLTGPYSDPRRPKKRGSPYVVTAKRGSVVENFGHESEDGAKRLAGKRERK